MSKHSYTEIEFKNAPDHKTTPLNASNLNHMEAGITDAFTDISETQEIIAPVQDTLTASRSYAVGDQFIYQNKLYKATAAIASGGSITIGGNCTLASTVTEQINTLDIPKIARGRATFTNSGQSVNLSYSSAGFTEAPTVMVVLEGSRSYARAEIGDSPLYVSNVTKNNCTVEVNRIANNNQIAFYYLAVGK